jgi:hypothetical protein
VTPGAVLVRQATEGIDQQANWSPESMGDVFAAVRELPDEIGALAETLSVMAATIEDARVVRAEIVTAIEVAAGMIGAAAAGMGGEFSRWTMTRTNGTRWLPPGWGAA